jgi:rRNA maturation protein Nop10
MAYLVTLAVVTVLAFFGGLLTFKIKARWCTACGTVKSCPRCAGWAGSGAPQGISATTTHNQQRRRYHPNAR